MVDMTLESDLDWAPQGRRLTVADLLELNTAMAHWLRHPVPW